MGARPSARGRSRGRWWRRAAATLLVLAVGPVTAGALVAAPAGAATDAQGGRVMGTATLTADQMAAYASARNSNPKIAVPLVDLARMYLEEGAAEGVRGDVAWVQALKETGYFAFGGSALPEWNNYCGLGVTGVAYYPATARESTYTTGVTVITSAAGQSVGVRFSEPRLGVRAQIQHLKAYASTLPLARAQVDPRFGYVTRGIAPTWPDLNGRWAVPGTTYGQDILAMYAAMGGGAAPTTPPPAPTTPAPAPAPVGHDVTGDGAADVLARDGGGGMWVYPGNGAGGWQARTYVGPGWDVMTAVVVGEVSGDGKADVLARDGAGALWVYPGDGAGRLGARVQVGSGWQGMTALLAPGDFSGDGKADVLARDGAGALWVYPGDGAGRLGARVQVGSGWQGMTALLAPGDFSGDGKADVLARDGAGALWLYPGDGASGWLARSQVGVGWQGMTALVAPGDFSGDGFGDVLARDGAGALWLYPGNGRGGWLGRAQVGSGWNAMSLIA